MTVLPSPARWPAPTATLILWALAAGSIVFWGLRLAAPAQSPVPPAVSSGAANWNTGDVARALGAVSAPEAGPAPAAATRYNVLGVVADGAQRGAALISIDGAAPRPYRVGQTVGDGYVLQSVDGREARLGADVGGTTTMTLQVPREAAPPLPARSTPAAPGVPGAMPAAPGKAPASAPPRGPKGGIVPLG